ncbi:hypothetical protein FH603_4538 [Spirosoma sp. LMG 31447]|uniref:Uncharacterized protein n=1 Tax=Spirosoma utsteinense TaxID=2585773 RepID=A0ABR6WBR2_9BACT|nr:hypothetical protein [Spirosoma utsteinense]
MTPVCSLAFTFSYQSIVATIQAFVLIMSKIQTCLYGLTDGKEATFVR